MKLKKNLVSKLTAGNIAVMFNAEIDKDKDLIKLLGAAFTKSNVPSCNGTIYVKQEEGIWRSISSTSLPIIDLVSFFEWKPKKYEKVLVRDNSTEDWVKGKYVGYDKHNSDGYHHVVNTSGSTDAWKLVKSLNDKDDIVEVTLEEIADRFNCDVANLKIQK